MKKDNSCIKCAFFCATCSTDVNKCDSCISGNTFRNDVSQNCSCLSSYYDNLNNPICQKCPYYCNQCELQNNQIICLSCYDSSQSKRNSQTTNCSCINGYYDDGYSQNCIKCPDNCLDCQINNGRVQCNKCLDGYSWNSSQLVCSQNQNCHKTCKTCSQANKEDSCIACPSERELITIGSQKFCYCRSGFYSSTESQCFQCHSNCKSCNGPSEKDCLSCYETEQNRILDSINQQCKCNDGFFEENNQCKKCNPVCKTCTDGNLNQCISCYEDQNKIALNGQCICRDGFYMKNDQCLSCHISCQTCFGDGIDQCKSCDELDGKVLNDNKCYCQVGKSLVNNICLTCDQRCKTCSQTNNLLCESCNDSQNRQLVQNQCICKDGFFENSIQQCEKCDENCQTCKAKGSSQCLSCDISENKVLSNSECVCQLGFFLEDGKCLKCDPICKSCDGKGPQRCNSCNQQLNLILKENQCVCKNGYFFSKNNCLSCHGSCQTCTNESQNNCQSCHENQNRYLSNSQCLCKDGYSEQTNNFECLKCSSFCQKCDGQKCYQCLPNLNRELNLNGTCECQKGYYSSNNSNICLKCSSLCKTCNRSDTECTSCNSDLRVLSSNQTCQCKEGYFEDPELKDCTKCQDGCSVCQNKQKCLQCDDNNQLDQNSNCKIIIPSTVTKEQLKSVSAATEKATTVVVGSTITSSVLLQSIQPNSSIASSFLKLQKLYFLLLINTTYPELLQTFLKAFAGKSPIDQINKFNFLSKQIFGEDKGILLPNKFGFEKIGENIIYNCGGSICIIIMLWIISLPFILYYKKQQKTQQMIEIKSKSLKLVCFFSEDLFPFVLILLHQILITIMIFSIGIELYAVIIYDAYEFDHIQVKLAIALIVFVYLLIFLFKIYKLINNQNNYQSENMYYNQKSLEILIYEQFNQETKFQTKLARNFQLIYIAFENILFPLIITLTESTFKTQIYSCISVQAILLLISLFLRPLKTSMQNFFLIIEQIVWVGILLSIYFIGNRVSQLESFQEVPLADIQFLTKLSWIVMGCCLFILILNPISMLIDLFVKRGLIKQKIHNFFCKQKLQKKQEITDNSISDDSLSIHAKNLSYNLINQKKFNIYNSQKNQFSSSSGLNIFQAQKSQIQECHLRNNQFLTTKNSPLNLTLKHTISEKRQIELFSKK